MKKQMQRTVVGTVDLTGVCIETGEVVKWMITSSPENFGVKFIRTDGDKILDIIQADHKSVSYTNGLVILSGYKSRVCGVEHILGILNGVGITNATVVCPTEHPPENSYLFTKLLLDRITLQKEEVKYFKFSDLYYEYGAAGFSMEVKPSDRLRISCSFTFDSPSVRNPLMFSLVVTPESFRDKISHARTFCTAKRLKMLQNHKHAIGANGTNCIVIPDEKIDFAIDQTELVRHKILDFLGDIYLLGSNALGDFNIVNPSHTATHEFIGYLRNGSMVEQDISVSESM